MTPEDKARVLEIQARAGHRAKIGFLLGGEQANDPLETLWLCELALTLLTALEAVDGMTRRRIAEAEHGVWFDADGHEVTRR